MSYAGSVAHIITTIEELKKKIMREEEEVEYKNWLEGILSSAVAVLRVAR